MPITNLSIPYPDFKLHEVIDPEQFDFNNGAIIEKVNAVLLVLNQITDSVADGGSGADKISITPIAPFTSNKLQAYLKEIIARLTSTTSGSSGAGFIGTPTVAGVTGTTVSAQLASLKSLLDTEKARITALETRATNVETRATSLEGRATTLEGKVATNEGNITSLSGRATSLEGRATALESGKSDKSTTYTKTEIDTKVFGTASLSDGSVTTPKIANQAVTADKIHPSLLENVSISAHRGASVLDHPNLSVTTEKLATESVTFDKLGSDVIAYVNDTSRDYAVDTGTANAKVITLTPAPVALREGMLVSFKNTLASTGAVTIDVNGFGAKAVVKAGGTAPNLKANTIYSLRYGGASFTLQGEGGEYGTAIANDVLAGKTIGTDAGLVNGNIPNYSRASLGQGYTGVTSAKGDNFGSLVVEPLRGYYEPGLNLNGYGSQILNAPDFIPSNIKQGVNIFGVVGTMIPGKPIAEGNWTSAGNASRQQRGLAFTPMLVYVYTDDGTNYASSTLITNVAYSSLQNLGLGGVDVNSFGIFMAGNNSVNAIQQTTTNDNFKIVPNGFDFLGTLGTGSKTFYFIAIGA